MTDISLLTPNTCNLINNIAYNEYGPKVNLFEKLIRASFPELDFNIIYNDGTNSNEIVLPLYFTNIPILKTNNWVEIKKNIEFNINYFTFELFKSKYDIFIKNYKYDKKKTDPYDKRKVECLINILNFSLKNNKIYIKKSNVHGLGVFAKEQIKKGTIITLYPPHYVVLYPNGRSKKNEQVIKGLIKSDIVIDNNLEYECVLHNQYHFDIDESYSICGDRQIINDMNFVGHMLNDGAGYPFKNDYNKKDFNLYNELSIEKNNSKFDIIDNIYVVIITTKDINIDDEILTAYGYSYWTP